MRAFEVIAAVNGSLVTVGAAFMLYLHSEVAASLTDFLVSVYIFVLAVVSLFCRCRIGFFIARLPFMANGVGTGLFYVFVGMLGLAFGVEAGRLNKNDLPFFVGLLSVCCGVACMIAECCERNSNYGESNEAGSPVNDTEYRASYDGAPSSSPGADSSSTAGFVALKYKPDRWAEVVHLRSCWGRARVVMTWINCVTLILGGLYGAIVREETSRSRGETQRALEAYMAFFGLVCLMYQFEVKPIVDYFQLLHSATSRGVFFLFVGLLGWCQGWEVGRGSRYADLVTLLVGGFSIATGSVCLVSRMRAITGEESGGEGSPVSGGPTPVTHLI